MHVSSTSKNKPRTSQMPNIACRFDATNARPIQNINKVQFCTGFMISIGLAFKISDIKVSSEGSNESLLDAFMIIFNFTSSYSSIFSFSVHVNVPLTANVQNLHLHIHLSFNSSKQNSSRRRKESKQLNMQPGLILLFFLAHLSRRFMGELIVYQ